MRIDLEYDVSDWEAQVSSYIDTAIRHAIAAGLTAAAEKVRDDLIAEFEHDIDKPVDSRSVASPPLPRHRRRAVISMLSSCSRCSSSISGI